MSARVGTSNAHRVLPRAVRAALISAVLLAQPALARPAQVLAESLNGVNGLRLDGVAAQDRTGRTVSRAGDLNGDGIEDFAIGAFRADPNGVEDAGAVYIVFGSTGRNPASIPLSSLDGSLGFRVTGAANIDRLGRSIDAAGDVNGDGIDDLIVSAYLADPDGINNAGSAYVIYGRTSGFPASFGVASLDGNNGFRLDGFQANSGAGLSVAGIGDFNGDGRHDLAICSASFDLPGLANVGATFVVHGRSQFPARMSLADLDGSNGFRAVGVAVDDFSCETVAGGDVNGDGRADVIVGTTGLDVAGMEEAGGAYVLFGAPGPQPAVMELGDLDGQRGFRLDGESAGDFAGVAVAVADLNGDGLGEVIVGAYSADLPLLLDAGSVYVLFGSTGARPAVLRLNELAAPQGFRIEGEAGNLLGLSLAGAGDVDGDGIGDILIGGPNAGPDQQGAAFLIEGRRQFDSVLRVADLDGDNGFSFIGVANSDFAGISVAGGDVNGDSLSDLLVGAHFRSSLGIDTNGVGYLIFGSAQLFSNGFEPLPVGSGD